MKTVLINRAVPGSGKTTFAKNIFAAVSSAGLSIAIHSTDEYFMRNDRYVFDVSMLGDYHRRDLAAFKKSLKGRQSRGGGRHEPPTCKITRFVMIMHIIIK